jgi:SH3-like domain-containing protein
MGEGGFAMKVRIMDHPVTVFMQADASGTPITQVMAGQVVEVGGIKNRNGTKWVATALPDGRRGYMTADTSIMSLRRAVLTQSDVTAYSQPSPSASVIAVYKKGNKFHIGETVTSHGQGWVTIVDAAGNEGFIDGKTRIKILRETTKAAGRKIMLMGAVWFVVGAAVTAFSLAMAAQGGTYIVAGGAVLGGIIQFFKGLHQFLTAPI